MPISTQSLPTWLEPLQTEPLPIRDLLAGSVYYPACGFDGDPVKYFASSFQSFVYVDYGYKRSEVESELGKFTGYRVISVRDVTPGDFGVSDISTLRKGTKSEKITTEFGEEEWFCSWSVHERLDEYGDSHGPKRFSMLYSNSDGVAFFRSIYWSNQASPAMIAIIQPGTGFGGNWTDFENQNGPLAKAVMGNPYGTPNLLLNGGWGDGSSYREPCWSVFSKSHSVLHGRLRCWAR